MFYVFLTAKNKLMGAL